MCCKCIAVNHIFATFSISKNRHNMLDGFITHVENKVNTTAVYGQIRKTLARIIIQDWFYYCLMIHHRPSIDYVYGYFPFDETFKFSHKHCHI